MTDYTKLCEALAALTHGVPHPIANLANAAALLWQYLEDINWAGFYLLDAQRLILGPFQGKPACIEIPIGKGVCGVAAASGQTQCIENVHRFPGHIACDSASNSEIVVPLFENGRLWGVMDIDSPSYARFSEQDRQGLEAFARIVEQAAENSSIYPLTK